MNRKVRCEMYVVVLAALFSLGCAPAGIAGPTGPYSRIIIDTYDPSVPGTGASDSTYMELWTADGTQLLTNDSGVGRPGTASQGYAYIDYTTTELPSGDYYVLVEETSGLPDAFPYAIRVLTAPDTAYAGWSVTPVTETVSDSPMTGPPSTTTSYKTIVFSNTTKDKLSRYITSSGVNWVKITLP